MAAHNSEIVKALKDICVNDKLNIFFLKESRELEYCIHNAGSDKTARLYLKHGDDFIEWESGPQAYGFWCAMREKNGADDPQPYESRDLPDLLDGSHQYSDQYSAVLRVAH